MNEQANIRPWLTIPHLPIRSGAFMAVLLGLITHGWFGSTASYLLLAVAGAALGLSAALTGKLISRWAVGLGVAMTVVGSATLGEVSWHGFLPEFLGRLLMPFGAALLAHLVLWLGADRMIEQGTMEDRLRLRRVLNNEGVAKVRMLRQGWRRIALLALVALLAAWLTIHLGYTRLPCSWLDPIRVTEGCQSALTSFGAEE